jgi:hypothetical protein
MLKKTYLLLIMFLLVIIVAFTTKAQQAGINLSLALPQGEFGEQVDNIGFGLSGEFLFLSPKPRSPFGLGLNIGYYVYGMESRKEPWSLTIPDVFLDVERTNNLLNFHVVFELGLPKGRIRPYVQGLFGGSYLYIFILKPLLVESIIKRLLQTLQIMMIGLGAMVLAVVSVYC